MPTVQETENIKNCYYICDKISHCMHTNRNNGITSIAIYKEFFKLNTSSLKWKTQEGGY